MLYDFALVVFAYLMGCVSTAVIVSRVMRLPDPRTEGSGNPGATNVLRLGGKKAAVLTLLGDVLKGVLPVLVAGALSVSPTTLALVCLAAFLGHLYPVFLRFRGGKGVATAFGVLVAANGWLGISLVVTWLVAALVTRYSSVSALIAAALAPFSAWWLVGAPMPLTVATAAMSVLLFWRHRSNIRHLWQGTEKKIGGPY